MRADEAPRAAKFSGLATDLYQLTMAAGYLAHGLENDLATFELTVRRFPPDRSFLMFAGLERALDYLHTLSFSPEEIDYLRRLPVFAGVERKFFDHLRSFRFEGEVWAMPEGTIFFPGETVLRVTAPLIAAQMVETFLLSTINFETLIATKASRVVDVAGGRGVIEFGARRAHGFEAATAGARAAFIGGCVGTSNLEAGYLYDLPVYGTAAHSWTMAFPREIDAFRAYFRVFPENTTLLLDTYDTIAASHLATEFGPRLRAVRLDSGDLLALSREVRTILDAAGMTGTQIMASGDLDEEKIEQLLASGAPIDLFGVGTEISTSRDSPALGGVYKLVEIERAGMIEPKMKLSRDKLTFPYRKQVWRESADDDSFVGDLIALATEEAPRRGDWESLLRPVMRGGERIAPPPTLSQAQEYARRQLARLPRRYKLLKEASPYPVRHSDQLQRRTDETAAAISDAISDG